MLSYLLEFIMKHSLLVILMTLFSSSFCYSNITIENVDLLPFGEKIKNPILLSEELPDDFPIIVIDTVSNPKSGFILMECFEASAADPNYIMVIDELGQVVYYDKPADQGVDFKLQPNGRFSYASRVKLGDKYQAGPINVQNIYVQHKILDEEFKVIDSVQMQNEYLADMHDFRILPNGNYLLIAYEHVHVDMSKIVPGGNPNAIVVGTVIQELDKNKNCVFQWRSLDYIPILATKDDPRKAIFEHVHGNSLFIDKDGNLITSFPTTFEIVKIDMTSGELIWRFGGDNNDFQITGDNQADAPYFFRMQHDAHRLPNGNLLFYDNAVNKKSGWNSRAVEYSFDEENRKAHMVWEFKHNPPISAFAMGSAQRLSNGNTFINWGLIFMGYYRTMTEVTSDKETVFELSMPKTTFSYRAQKIDLPACQPIANVDKFEMLEGNDYLFNEEDQKTDLEIHFIELDAFMYNMINVKKYDCSPLNPQFDGEAPVLLNGRYFIESAMVYSHRSQISIDINSIAPHSSAENLIVFYRPKEGEGVFTLLQTNYDASEKQLVCETTEYGEFVIGFVRDAYEIMAPTLMTPPNNKIFVNDDTVKLIWSATGRYDAFQLQIATDNNFSEIVFDSSNIKISIVNKGDFEPGREYFWRARSFYRDSDSEWSSTRMFAFDQSFINLTYPNGGEHLTKDTTIVIRWESNLSDSVSVKLLKNQEPVLTISDGIYSYSNAIAWKIPNTLPDGNDYTIKVESIKSGEMQSQSQDFFTLQSAVSVSDYPVIDNIPQIELSPNPANQNLTMSLLMNESGYIRLSIFDHLGIEQKLVLNTYLNEGSYKIPLNVTNLSTGVYYCTLNTGKSSQTTKLLIIR